MAHRKYKNKNEIFANQIISVFSHYLASTFECSQLMPTIPFLRSADPSQCVAVKGQCGPLLYCYNILKLLGFSNSVLITTTDGVQTDYPFRPAITLTYIDFMGDVHLVTPVIHK